MPKKKTAGKKGSGKKKAPLTGEELLMLAKHEEQRVMARQELAVQFLKEKLAQEQKNTNISVKKLNQQWRQILRQVKSEELKKEILILSQTFERTLDRKDAVLKALAADLDEADQQMDRAGETHAEKVDELVAFHAKLIADLKSEFSIELAEVQKEFQQERAAIIEQHEKELAEIKDIQFAMNLTNEKQEGEETAAFTNRRDEIRARHMDQRAELKQRLEAKIKNLWDLFQQAQKNYEHNTAEKMAEFERLRAKDQAYAETLAAQNLKITKLQEKLQSCKLRMAASQKDCDQRNRELKQQKEETLGSLQHLKSQMAQARARAREKLTALATQAKDTTDTLVARLAKGEKLLLQAELCRKFETEEEKILPFYEDSVLPEEVEQETGDKITALNLPEPFAPHAMAFSQDNMAISEYAALDNFWKRHNKVLLDKLALEKKRAQLQEENDKLRGLLQEYLQGISVNEEVLSQANSLVIVNGRTNARMNVPVGDARVKASKRPTVVEARDVIHAQRLANR